jgi:hypothetical protein
VSRRTESGEVVSVDVLDESYIRSQSAGERVLAGVANVLETKLKLQVNRENCRPGRHRNDQSFALEQPQLAR